MQRSHKKTAHIGSKTAIISPYDNITQLDKEQFVKVSNDSEFMARKPTEISAINISREQYEPKSP